MDLLKSLLTKTLFEWSRNWGFEVLCMVLLYLIFLILLTFPINLFVSLFFLFLCSEFTIVNSLYFSYQ